MLRMLTATLVVGLTLGFTAPGTAQDKNKEKDPLEGKKGTVVGMLTAKDKNWIEVKADGEEKARRYVPQWVGGAPAQGGGPDKEMLKTFHDLKIGSRIEVEWLFEERLRSMKVKLVKGPPDEKKAEEKKSSKTVGALLSREEGKWIEVKADGEEKGRKYFVHAKMPEKLLAAVKQAPVGSRVSVEWVSTSHGPMIQAIEVLTRKKE